MNPPPRFLPAPQKAFVGAQCCLLAGTTPALPHPPFLPLSRAFGIKHLLEGRGLGPLPPPCFWLDLGFFLQKSWCQF